MATITDSLTQFIKGKMTDSMTTYTHQSMTNPKCKLAMSAEDTMTFMNMYINRKVTIPRGFSEPLRQNMPVIADFDIKVDVDEKYELPLYTENDVTSMVGIYVRVMKELLVDFKDEMGTCIVLEKDPYELDTATSRIVKNGVHLHFPYCFVSRNDFAHFFIPKVIEYAKEQAVFSRYNIPIDKIIDTSVAVNPWLMYGSVKEEWMKPYVATKVYDCHLNEHPIQILSDYTIYDCRENEVEKTEPIEHYLPFILSVIPNNRDEYVREFNQVKKSILIKKPARQIRKFNKKKGCEIDLGRAAQLVNLLNPDRSKYRSQWISIGWILFNISEGSNEGYELWNEFSKRASDAYDEMSCLTEWNRMVPKDMSMGSLVYFAKNDSPEDYAKLKLEQAKNMTNISTHVDIARIMHVLYSDSFVCSSIGNKKWYMFSDHTWVEIDSGVYMRKKISDKGDNTIDSVIENMYKTLVEKKTDLTVDEKDRKQDMKKLASLLGTRDKLGDSTFKTKVLKELEEIFYQEDFEEKLDMNWNLIAFKNGVYDLQTNTFRDGQPDDYLSKHMHINYRTFDDDSQEMLDIVDFFKKVFVRTELREYFIDVMSTFFVGGNAQKKVWFWEGVGDNAKSIMQYFIEHMFGPHYCVKFDTTLFTQKKGSAAGANPQLARAGPGVRLGMSEEPDAGEDLQVGLLKILSGQDSKIDRDLFQKGKDTKERVASYKVIFTCNQLPEIKGFDNAMSNRVEVITFESIFDDEAPATYEEQVAAKHFPVDKNFRDRIPHLVEALAYFLLKRRMTHFGTLAVPKCVIEPTDKYRERNSMYFQFLKEEFVVDNLPESKLGISEVYNKFKDWYKNINPGKNDVPKRITFSDCFTKATKLKKHEKTKKWIGIRFKTGADDVSDGEEDDECK